MTGWKPIPRRALTMNEPSRRSALISWAQLVRLPNVFTVIADVGAAFLLVAHGPDPIWTLLLVLSSGIALYWAGMILNDVFDIDRDRKERPTRPIAAGDVSLGAANRAGWLLLVIGVSLAFGCGLIPGAIAVVLAVMVVAYDGPLKSTPMAPAAMGSCRVLSFLLGASSALAIDGGNQIPNYVLGIALGFGVYIMGVTTMARHEATGGRSALLASGLVVTIVGIAILAFSPRLGTGALQWHTDPQRTFPWMIGLISFPVMVRAVRAVADPTPLNIQTTIRVGILSIIPLAASFAFLGAGPIWGLAVFALVIPSVVLAARFRVT
jgi:4-hydroxybenzoate polyprenyltransferase